MHHENEKMALFEALYREYLVPLKKYAYRIGVGYDDIEDMVHEAFIEYYKRYSLDLDHKVKLVLLIRILRSKWIDNRRQMRRRFKQKIKAGEVGSSAMPHKVNPIDFENAEGNLGIATSILEHLAVKLPVSRLQRDLTDSTVLRNVGVPFGHIVIAIQSSLKGLRKLLLNEPAIYRDLDNCWSVVAEAIQTILRREAYPRPYEALKALTRTNQAITESSIKEFIEGLNVSEDIKKELRAITPHTYTGL